VGALRDEHAHPAEAEDAERLAVQFHAFPTGPVPVPCVQVGVGLRDVARLREQQRDRVLGRREDVRLGRVHHHHAAPGCFGDVDVVEPDAGPPDDDEVTARGQHLGRHAGRAPDDQRGRTPHRVEELLGRQPGALLDVETGRSHRFDAARGERFGDEDAVRHGRGGY
jgi:hypothetical protein